MCKEIERKLNQKKIAYDPNVLAKACDFAGKAHEGQKRATGDPYIAHPLAVAEILADMGMEFHTIIAALLHDTVEDTSISLDEIEKQFGKDIRSLVNGVTKLSEIEFSRQYQLESLTERQEMEVENFRKFFLAIAEDLRVVLIKLADRLHNLETLGAKSPASQKRVAQETLEIYVPLADRLGIGQLKVDLEDLAFRYFMPDEYQKVRLLVSEKIDDRKKNVNILQKSIPRLLTKNQIKVIKIEGRAKHFYSIYKKLKKSDGDIDKIYDLMAIRIIVPEESDCYKVLGVIHQQYKPLIYRIKDYIAVPKPNGYKSLHTTVFGLDGRITEIQIRTPKMHDEAEMGIAAHWHYNQSKSKIFSVFTRSSYAPKNDLEWVKQLAEAQKGFNDKELIENLKIDFFHNRIFIFSPKGNIFNLPEGATPIDFAYLVHTEIGNHYVGAKVNGKIVNLNYKLENRDIVEILTSPKAKPSRDWLNFVKTSGASQNIRSWFRKESREDNLKSGEETLVSKLKAVGLTLSDIDERILSFFNVKNTDDLFVLIGEGQITSSQVTNRILDPGTEKQKRPSKTKRTELVIKGTEGMPYRLAKCCQPCYGDKITGYVTQGQGITVHRTNCANIIRNNPNKLTEVSWQSGSAIYQIPILVKAKNRIGLLKDITYLLTDKKINIGSIKSKHEGDMTVIEMLIEIEKMVLLPIVINNLLGIKDVYEVKRLR